MRPLILISNDDGVEARGIRALTDVARRFGDVVVMAPINNASGQSHSITTTRPLRVKTVKEEDGLGVYACDGTPADCVKLAAEYFCPRNPDLVLSGINHGSNSSINVMYSGTMGAVIEASAMGFPAIGFSLLSHSPEADFESSIPYIEHIIDYAFKQGLPKEVSLNVNIPRLPATELKGIRICCEAKARWMDSYEKRLDPQGRPYWWLTGKFVCDQPSESSDEWALAHGYVSVVPVNHDATHYQSINQLKGMQL